MAKITFKGEVNGEFSIIADGEAIGTIRKAKRIGARGWEGKRFGADVWSFNTKRSDLAAFLARWHAEDAARRHNSLRRG